MNKPESIGEIQKVTNVLLKAWRENRNRTYDFVKGCSIEELNEKLPRPGLDTFAKHVIEMAGVQRSYVRVLENKPLDFTEVIGITFGEQDFSAKNKAELLEILKKGDEYFDRVVGKVKDWDNSVELFGEKLPKFAVLELIARHETLHHGQIIAFSYLLKKELPQSWITAWALPRSS